MQSPLAAGTKTPEDHGKVPRAFADHGWLRPGNAGPKGELKDDNLKFGEVVLWVRSPPGQSLVSRPVARLAVAPAMGRLKRSQANTSAAEQAPKVQSIPVLKGSFAQKAASSEAIGRAEEGPAGSWAAAGLKRTTQ